MPTFSLPYGRSHLEFTLPDTVQPDMLTRTPAAGVPNPEAAVIHALDNLLGDLRWGDLAGLRSVAIAINDKTRPVPHHHLLPPLLNKLEAIGYLPENIRLIIATGTHPPMPPDEFTAVVPPAILQRYPILCHDTDESEALTYLGDTGRGTPVWINRSYLAADLRIVVGNIEPHQFQGFSGGIKSAAIGLAGRATVNHNHAMMSHAQARLGEFRRNPARQDVEEIGQMIGVHLALNAILNDKKEIVTVLAGTPTAVLSSGMPIARSICQLTVAEPYDVVIAAPGGHPKDINVYQSQKGLAHARLITKTGGAIVLAAACPEGTGSRGYERWVTKRHSHDDVMAQFKAEGFYVGPHKAFQIARDALHIKLLLVSEMAPAFVRQLLLEPAATLPAAVAAAVAILPPQGRIGIMPQANTTIPLLTTKEGRS